MPLLFFRVRVASGFREERLLAASGDSSFSLRSVGGGVVVDLCITVLRRKRKRNCLPYVRVLWHSSTLVGTGGENAIVPISFCCLRGLSFPFLPLTAGVSRLVGMSL